MRKYWCSTRKQSTSSVMSVIRSSLPLAVWSSMYSKFIRRTLPNEEMASKSAKVDAVTNPIGPAIPAVGVGFPPQPAFGVFRPPIYNPSVPSPIGWQVPRPQPWYPPTPAVSVPSVRQPQAPLFPVQSVPAPLPSAAPPVPQPAFQMNLPGSLSSPATVPVSQPLFPVGTPTSVPNQSLPVAPPLLSAPVPVVDVKTSVPMYANANNHVVNSYHWPTLQVGSAGNSHSYASGPNTGGPSIGPPPVISNKAPAPQPASNEVYLVWDDDPISMEERRMSLPKYQVHDETSQMNSVDAAIDRRISESRLAGGESVFIR